MMCELDEAALKLAEQAYYRKTPFGTDPANAFGLASAIHAYLDATAPSRAPDGGVTREEDNAGSYVDQHIVELMSILQSNLTPYIVHDIDTGAPLASVHVAKAAFALHEAGYARIAASRVGDREWLETDVCNALYPIIGDAPVGTWELIEAAVRSVLAPAAGQDDAREAKS